MKKTIYTLLIGVALMATSCAKFTEIQPKGKNLLSTADQLEMLLNNDGIGFSSMDFWQMSGDVLYAYDNVPTRLSNPTKTRRVLEWTWDDTQMDLMASLTSSDSDYSGGFSNIGKICNPILSKVDASTGDDATKNRIKCEALVMRAYMEYIMVNKFAKAYNAATAATDPGIAYLTEDADITEMQPKLTVQQVYDHILADVNEAIEIDGLPEVAVNKMRFSKPCAFAVKALALMSMQKPDEAEAAARQALAINGTVLNYSTILGTATGYILGGTYTVLSKPEHYYDEDYYVPTPDYIYFESASPEAQARFEKGNMFLKYMGTINMMYDYAMDYTGTNLGLPGYVTFYDFDSYWNRYGLNTPQMYFIVAEAEIDKGDFNAAMDALDKVRACRIDPAVYAPLKGTVTTKEEAIKHLKQTVHGDCICTIYNFINRKRWNQLTDYKETYTKTINGTVYTFKPDSPMWIFPFPKNVTAVNTNMTQNYK